MILEDTRGRVRGVKRGRAAARRILRIGDRGAAPGFPDHLALGRSAPQPRSNLKAARTDPGALSHLVANLLNTEKGAKVRYRESLREQFQQAGIQRVLGEPATP